MRALEFEFTYDQFHFRQIMRKGNVVLWEKSSPAHSCPGYEVVVVQRHPAQTIHGRNYPERESMPPSESWGRWGWSYSDLESANSKFSELIANCRNAESPPAPFPHVALESAHPFKAAELQEASLSEKGGRTLLRPETPAFPSLGHTLYELDDARVHLEVKAIERLNIEDACAIHPNTNNRI